MHLIAIFWIENIYTKQTSRALWVKSKLAFKAMLIIMIISLSIAQLSLRSKKGLWRSQTYFFLFKGCFYKTIKALWTRFLNLRANTKLLQVTHCVVFD